MYRIPQPSVAGFAPINVRFVAGVECRLGGISAPDELRVWELRETEGRTQEPDEYAAPNAIVTQKANAAPMVTCTQQVPALEEWSFGENAGLLTCYETNTGDAVLWWSYEGTDIVATAIRADQDMTALLEWWTAYARFTPRVSVD